MADVPPEEFARLPRDGARQVDHYVYGLPRRPPVVTTEEVLTEFLTYFSGRGSLLCMKAAAAEYALRDDPDVRLRPQTFESFAGDE